MPTKSRPSKNSHKITKKIYKTFVYLDQNFGISLYEIESFLTKKYKINDHSQILYALKNLRLFVFIFIQNMQSLIR